nr:CoA transferase [Cupriavidus necator]
MSGPLEGVRILDLTVGALKRMLRSADVLLYSLRPQAMARLGLSYEAVRELNPRLIYCGAFGFGQNRPYASRPAYDDLIQAAVGLPVLQGRPEVRDMLACGSVREPEGAECASGHEGATGSEQESNHA